MGGWLAHTSARPKLAVDTAIGWKGIIAKLAALSARSWCELLGNSARTICVEARAIVQSAAAPGSLRWQQ